jgi:hypothetical protein
LSNSPFHQAVQERLPLNGNALRLAQAYAGLTGSEHAARDRRPYDFLTDPEIVQAPDGHGGTTYRLRSTGQVLSREQVLAGLRRAY